MPSPSYTATLVASTTSNEVHVTGTGALPISAISALPGITLVVENSTTDAVFQVETRLNVFYGSGIINSGLFGSGFVSSTLTATTAASP